MARAPKEKPDYSQQVADRLIEQLEAGVAPWQKPWAPGTRFAPYNPTTDKEYRGMNSVWLMMQGRTDSRWMTYRQAEGQGAQVRKGESGTLIQYWKVEDRQKVLDDRGNPVLDSDGKAVMRTVRLEKPRVMSAVVFNAEQIDNLPELVQRPALPEFERHARAEAMLAASPAALRHINGDQAYYMPSTDMITLPEPGQFHSPDAYYATALHEVGHSTGHPSRLDRDLSHPFGSEGYAREELRAEIASLMLGEQLGIGHDPGNHVAYVQSWIRKLREDPREIFRAAADAEKIMKFMLDLEREKQIERGAAEPAPAGDVALSMTPDLLESILGPWQGLDSTKLSIRDMLLDVSGTWDRSAEVSAEAAAIVAKTSIDAFARRPSAVELFDSLIERHHGALRPVVAYLNDHSPGWRNGLEQRQAPDQGAKPVQNLAPERVTLNVPYAEKEHAKAAGARWDKEAKHWYAPQGADLDKLARWHGDAPAPRSEIPEVEFKAALLAAGLVIPATDLPVMNGEMQRVQALGDKAGARSGAYVGYKDGHPAGFIQNYLKGTKENWKSERIVQSLPPQDRARMLEESEQRRAERNKAQVEGYEKTAATIVARLEQMPAANGQHPYLVEKAVLPLGLREMDGGPINVPPGDPKPMLFGRKGDLIVPYRDIDGKVWGAQAISPNGRKSLPKGAKLVGCFHMIGDPNGANTVAIAEGYSTAATIHQATGLPVAVAFNANNLRVVAEAIHGRYPDHALLIAGDNDHRREQEGGSNVGKAKAEEAALQVGAQVVLPPFQSEEPGSDWNDFARSRGDAAVSAEFRQALAIAQRKELAQDIREEREEILQRSLGQQLEAATRERSPEREPELSR